MRRIRGRKRFRRRRRGTGRSKLLVINMFLLCMYITWSSCLVYSYKHILTIISPSFLNTIFKVMFHRKGEKSISLFRPGYFVAFSWTSRTMAFSVLTPLHCLQHKQHWGCQTIDTDSIFYFCSFLCAACMFSLVSVWIPSGSSDFLPQTKDIRFRVNWWL